MHKPMNEQLKKLQSYSKTEEGGTAIKWIIIGFIAGIFWMFILLVVVVLAGIYAISYILDKKKEGVQVKKVNPHKGYQG